MSLTQVDAVVVDSVCGGLIASTLNEFYRLLAPSQ